MIAWRIAKARHAQSIGALLNGEGARLVGGRWNSKGRRAVYAASTLSLAMLEVLVHVQSPRVLRDYRMLDLQIPDDAIADVDSTGMDAAAMREAGDRFLMQARAIALRARSVVNPFEFNVMINPDHPDVGRITAGELRALEFDQRLA